MNFYSLPDMEGQSSPAAGKGLKRPRPMGVESLTELSDVESPDLAEFQRSFDLTDEEMIRICTAYASYLKACLRKRR